MDGFNYRRYLNSNGYYGSIMADKCKIIKTEFSSMNLVYGVQNYISDTLGKYLTKNFSGILSGMIIGDTSNISSEIKADFQKTGLTHLLAVSGSNVAMVILFSNYMVVKLFGKRYSDYISIIFIIFFVLISGASPSVVRAGIMAILNLLANVFIRRTDSVNNLIVASFVILIYNPLTLINVGFLLSFAGTIGIITFSKDIRKFIDKYITIKTFAEIISLNLSAQIMILPITIYFFNSFSLVGILANLLIIPVISFLTFSGISILFSSLISASISKIVSLVINLITNYVLAVIKFLEPLDFLNITIPTPALWMIVSYYIVLYLKYSKYKMKNQNYILRVSESKNNLFKLMVLKGMKILICTIIIFGILLNCLPRNYTEITAIDVGQGDSFLIVTEEGKRILIDGGGSETTDYDVGKNILMPYLLDRGFMKVDYIFVSHAHADHIDGIYTIVENFEVGKIFIGPQLVNDEKIMRLKEIVKEKKVEIIEIFEGNKIKIEDLEFEILYPPKEVIEENVNNLSLIMKLNCNGKEILFTGDAEEKVEEYLIKKYPSQLDVDILKVGHHGAKTSSSEEFIKNVSPSISIISVDKDNNYGHPNKDVLKRLERFREDIKNK